MIGKHLIIVQNDDEIGLEYGKHIIYYKKKNRYCILNNVVIKYAIS